MARVSRAGVQSFTIDSNPYDVADSVTWEPNGLVKTTLEGMTSVPGFSSSLKAGKITASIYDDGIISVSDFLNMSEVDVVLILRNGKTVVGRSMWLVGEVAVDLKAGTMTLSFEGPDVTER